MIRTLAAALATTTCIVALATPAAAQTREFHVPAGSLRAALDTYARQSGRQVIYGAEVRSARSPGVRGARTADDALNAILAGTGFVAKQDRSGALAIVKEGNEGVATQGNPMAASEAGTGSASGESSGGEVVVTGSRIRGSNIVSTTTVGREQARAQGLNELGEVIRSLPQNYSGGQNPGIGDGAPGSEDVNSSSALNLRGLGPDATLTLVNGHRMAYDAVAQGVDIAAIPLIAIERLEVLNDGSSALYGSDAVGGVANVILRSPFTGGEARARLSVPTAGGGVQDQYSALAGITWSGGGVIAALDYLHAEPIAAGDRSFTPTLNPITIIMPGQTQYSGVLSGRHAPVDRISIGLDAHFNRRTSSVSAALFSPGDINIDGTVSDREVQSYSLAPSVTWDLTDWQIKLSGVYGVSDSDLNSLSKSGGQENVRAFVSYRNAVESAELGAEGPVFSLPGGKARIALGAGWRGVELDGVVRSTVSGIP